MYNIADTYYSVGPLQRGGIEEWVFTNDKYDKSRLEIGNVFKTREEAEAFKQTLINIKEKRE